MATLNKKILSSFATHDALSLVITHSSFIWFGSTRVDIRAVLVNNWKRRGCLSFFVHEKLEIIKSETRKILANKCFEKFLSKHEKHHFLRNNEETLVSLCSTKNCPKYGSKKRKAGFQLWSDN